MSKFPIRFIPRGLPDIMILNEGKFIGLEVKVPGYWKHTDLQKKVGDLIEKNGGLYQVVTSLGQTIEYLADYMPEKTILGKIT